MLRYFAFSSLLSVMFLDIPIYKQMYIVVLLVDVPLMNNTDVCQMCWHTAELYLWKLAVYAVASKYRM